MSRLAETAHAMLLFGRDKKRLGQAGALAKANGARVSLSMTSVEDHENFSHAIAEFDRQTPIDLFMANAGVKCGNTDGIEKASQLERIIGVNLTGTMLSVQSVLPMMLKRRQGQIALISSLAARSPQGALLSYSATKAGIDGYATALRRKCVGSGVSICLVRPGFVDTPMTDRQLGPAPFKISAASAAIRICHGLERKKPNIAFPRRLALLAELERLLPTRIADQFANRFDANILPDEDEIAALRDRLDNRWVE